MPAYAPVDETVDKLPGNILPCLPNESARVSLVLPKILGHICYARLTNVTGLFFCRGDALGLVFGWPLAWALA